jgi:hypothetical protein
VLKTWTFLSELDPGLNKLPHINFFGLCKSHTYFRTLCGFTFWFIFPPKKFPEETWSKICAGQDPDPNVFKSGSGQTSSGSAALEKSLWISGYNLNYDSRNLFSLEKLAV